MAEAEEARAADTARQLHEAEQQKERLTQANGATGAKHAHDGEDGVGKDPQIARSNPTEPLPQGAEEADAATTDGEGMSHISGKGSEGKGKGSCPDDKPY